jgi:hypothetical protein
MSRLSFVMEPVRTAQITLSRIRYKGEALLGTGRRVVRCRGSAVARPDKFLHIIYTFPSFYSDLYA